MGGFIAKQPNGLYCRFSTVVDCPTHYNMTEKGYINYCVERAKEEAKKILANHLYPFEDVIEKFVPGNMSEKEFQEFLAAAGYELK